MSTFKIIHGDATADFSSYLYSAIYCNATNPITVNGETINCVAGETIPVTVHETGTTLSADFLLLGGAKPIVTPTGAVSGNSFTYTDIRTGLPITDRCCK